MGTSPGYTTGNAMSEWRRSKEPAWVAREIERAQEQFPRFRDGSQRMKTPAEMAYENHAMHDPFVGYPTWVQAILTRPAPVPNVPRKKG